MICGQGETRGGGKEKARTERRRIRENKKTDVIIFRHQRDLEDSAFSFNTPLPPERERADVKAMVVGNHRHSSCH